jgi:HAD superfamily hydrolase (TIGR01509 family)
VRRGNPAGVALLACGQMIQAVLFDWDGTLADTAEASFRCYEKLFAEMGVAFDRDTYARTYSPNWYVTFRMLDIPESRWREADSRWLEHFAAERVEMIDGARELLDLLAERGIAAGLVTSGSRERVQREIEEYGLAAHLGTCVFGCDVEEKKPHPAALLLALGRLGVPPEAAVYVGDSPEDIAMARAARVYSVAVPGRYPNREALLAAAPDAVADSLRAVADLIDTM